MQDTGCLGLVHGDDPGGWYGKEGGRGVQDGEHVYTLGRFMLMYGRSHHSIVIALEPIIQSEVSQKEKHQYSILMHIYGI